MRSPGARIAILLGSAVLLVGLFAVLRGRDDDDGPTTAAQTTRATTAGPTTTTVLTTTPTTTAPTTTRPPNPGPRVIRVVVRDGRPVGGVRSARVRQNARIRIVVTADVSDHVHLHGYDLTADVAPGQPARIALRATIAGRFEVELEDRGLPILELEVRP
jgi:hypothetical protein